ncbi:glutamine-hydrolyzing carbamoyl-phosphate synthase small subunit [Patescibacteria group bacterium]
MKKAFLVLEDGTKIEGTSFGADVDCAGEVVFNTGMMGYPESFTDPSYTGQILTLTYPLIGNYGVPGDEKDKFKIPKNFESSKIHIKGLIVSEHCEKPSHWNSVRTLAKWLKENKVPAISGIDTRALTQKLREKGTMLGKIMRDPDKNMEFYNPDLDNLVAKVSCKRPITYKAGRKKVVLMDCGAKNNIIRSLLARNITVIRVPWNYDFIEKGVKFDGVFISNGPGDPTMITETHEIIKKCYKLGKPIMGICLGNQIMAIAAGGKTYKLKYGHRAQNQPCTDVKTGRCYITSQNHGFAVRKQSLPTGFEPLFVNANDKTVEGIKHKRKPFMAVQFHPEATPGPNDTNYLFDEFFAKL